MSGGSAYVMNLDPQLVNREMVDLEDVSTEDSDRLRDVITRYESETGSPVAAELLANWERAKSAFTKIMPRDYRRVLEATRQAEAAGRDVGEAIMEAARG
jgi:glutamate synthase (NADPH/NADH) large chain